MPQTSPSEKNPLLEPWTGPFEAPPFDLLKPEHFRPAFDLALEEARAEIAAIAKNPEPPTFQNTIEALERSGRQPRTRRSVFFNLAGVRQPMTRWRRSSAKWRPCCRAIAARSISMKRCSRRVDALHAEQDKSQPRSPNRRACSSAITSPSSAMARGLPESSKARLAEIDERLATLGTQFGQNVLADEKAYLLSLESEDLAGLPPSLIASGGAHRRRPRPCRANMASPVRVRASSRFCNFPRGAICAKRRFAPGQRAARTAGATDNRAIAAETVELRAERAKLLGFDELRAFPARRYDGENARRPRWACCSRSGRRRARRALREEEALAGNDRGGRRQFPGSRPWDWRYYAEKRRKAEFDLDEGEIKPYLQLDKMIEAAFYTANRLFGLTFSERRDIELYHPDARAWTVAGARAANPSRCSSAIISRGPRNAAAPG